MGIEKKITENVSLKGQLLVKFGFIPMISLAFSALLRNTLKNTVKTSKASHMRKLKTLPKICLLSVFQHVRLQNEKY